MLQTCQSIGNVLYVCFACVQCQFKRFKQTKGLIRQSNNETRIKCAVAICFGDIRTTCEGYMRQLEFTRDVCESCNNLEFAIQRSLFHEVKLRSTLQYALRCIANCQSHFQAGNKWFVHTNDYLCKFLFLFRSSWSSHSVWWCFPSGTTSICGSLHRPQLARSVQRSVALLWIAVQINKTKW